MFESPLRFVLLWMVVGAASAAPAQAADWKVAFAARKVTPSQRVYLSGYASRNRPFESVDAELYVKALLLEDSRGHRGLLITSDLIGFRGELAGIICERIQKTTGLQRREILLNSSHTHTGPLLSLDITPSGTDMTDAQAAQTVAYTRELIEQVVGVAQDVTAAPRRAAELKYAVGVAGFVMNRREYTPTGVRLGVNPRGLADRSVPVLRIDVEGKLAGVVFGTACHNTTLSGQHYMVSGDFAGYAQDELQRRHPGVQAMFVQGCGGSANPYPRGSLEISKRHGSDLAAEVDRVLGGSPQVITGELATVLGHVDLPLMKALTEEQLSRLESGRSGWQPWVARRMRERLEADGKLPDHYRSPQAVWQIGSLTLVGLSGEVVVDYVPLIEQALGPRNLWIAAYCNDVYGYLPSARVIAEGGYETRGLIAGGVGFFSSAAERTLVERLGEMAAEAGRSVPAK